MRSDVDNINNLLGTTINFGNGDGSFRGAIGAARNLASHTNEVWILGRVWDEFAGNNNTVDLLNPGVPLTVADNVFTQRRSEKSKGGLTLLRSAEAGRPT